MADESKPSQASESTKPEPKDAAQASAPKSVPAPVSPANPIAAKPAAPAPKVAPPVQTPLDNDLVRRYRERFGAAILDALEDRKQPYLVIDAAQFLEIARYSRDEEKFDLLEDFTAVDWPRREKRFDLIAILYSFAHNTRLRLKIPIAADEHPSSLVGHLAHSQLAGARNFRHVRH